MKTDSSPSNPTCPACRGYGPHARTDARWKRYDSDATCPTCGAASRPLLVEERDGSTRPANLDELAGWAHALLMSDAEPPDAESAAVDETLDILREVLLSLPEEELAAELARLRGRAVLLDPRNRPAGEGSRALTRTCPRCSGASRAHKFQPRMWVCTVTSCAAIWSHGRNGVEIEPVV